MIVLRASRKFTERFRETFPVAVDTSGNGGGRLGDFYAELITIDRKKFALLMSERSFLTIVVAAAVPKTFGRRFRETLGQVLTAIGVAGADVRDELSRFDAISLAKPAERKIARLLSQMEGPARICAMQVGDDDLTNLSLEISKVPVFILPTGLPIVEARRLFGVTENSPSIATPIALSIRLRARKLAESAMNAEANVDEDDIEESIDLFYEASDAPTTKLMLDGLEFALEHDSRNVDALLALLDIGRVEAHDRIPILEDLVRTSADRLRETTFRELRGVFWLEIDTRPYIRARFALASALAETGRYDDAIGHFRELLELSPSDNIGARYELTLALAAAGHLDEAKELVASYPEETRSTVFAWIDLLAAVMSEPVESQLDAYRRAMNANPYIEEIILGRRPFNETVPDHIERGSPAEADTHAPAMITAWTNNKTSLKRLAELGKLVRPLLF